MPFFACSESSNVLSIAPSGACPSTTLFIVKVDFSVFVQNFPKVMEKIKYLESFNFRAVEFMRMVTRTFRMNPEYDKILNEEAEKHGLTVSALLNQMIRQYILITRFSERVPAITLSYNTFAPILELVSDKDLVDVAEKTGSIVPEEAMLQRGEKLTFDSVNWFIDTVYGRYGNWFDPFTSRINGNERIHLMHQLNHKWSQYLGGYMRSMFTSILDLQPKIETRENSVTINVELPKTSPSNISFKKTKNKI